MPMAATVADLNPKTLENAKRQFVELYGSALVMNTYLKIALVLVSLVALGLVGLNIHTASTYANVKLSELTKPPYKAAVTFQKLVYTPGTRAERARQTYVAQVDFVIRGHVPNEFVRVNPLGLQVTYFRVDQAFEEPRR